MSRQVFFIVGIDDDHKPIHTTRVCSTLDSAVRMQKEIAARSHNALLCREVSPNEIEQELHEASGMDFLEDLENAKIIFDPTFDHHYGAEQPPKVVLISKELHQNLMSYFSKK